jgi:hypothetical protein
MKHSLCRWIRYALLLALAPETFLAAEGVQCPAQVDVRQQLTVPVAGWSALQDDSPHILAGITFYDGRPEDKASLAPDSEKRLRGKIVSTWLFGQGPRPVWVACRYAGTSVVLTREAPKGLRTCSVIYNPGESVGGLPAIEKIDCK